LTAARDGGTKIFWVAWEPYNYEQTMFGPIHCANDPKQPLNTLPNPKRQQVLVRITSMLYKEFTAEMPGHGAADVNTASDKISTH